MLLDLADWSVENALYYRWSYSWKDILKFYKRKETKYAERKKVDYEFLIDLTTAALGGKKKSNEEVTLDNGEGLGEMAPEQEAAMRAMLGSDFDRILKQNTD